jgi:peptide deformylase
MTEFDLAQWLKNAPSQPPIVQAGAAVLRKAAIEVPEALFGTEQLARLVDRMVEAMRSAPGVGLAAPQIGVPLRLLVAEDTEERLTQIAPEARALRARTALPLTVIANPKVALEPGEEATFYEGCLSVHGYAALVRRAFAVTVAGMDPAGNAIRLRAVGWPARIFQHEVDHLDGTLYVDRMISRSLTAEGDLARLSAMRVGDVLRELVDRDET